MRLYLGKMGGIHNLLAGAAGLVLLLIFGFMLFPTTPQLAQAEEGNSKASLTINPVIGLSMQDTITVDVTPTQDGTFSSSTASLSVSTNNETGYSLYLSTANGENTLASQNPAISDVVSAVDGGESGITSINFANNTWGYSLSQEIASDTTTYKAVPTTANDAIITTESPTDADTYNLTIGTKISTSLPSGIYSNQVVVSVVANPAYIPPFDGITTMQEMTSTICANAEENETARLTDIRDNKQYWVTKLADGNCWMTQNLDLDLTNGEPLTSEDSDVSSSWDPPRSTEPQGTITSVNTNTETYSWDLGMYVKSDPDGYSNYCNSVANLANSSCSSAGWTNVSSMTPMTDGTSNVAISGSQYNAHYLVGNLYQWNAVTAGTGGSDMVSANAPDSICPKGWHLPTSNNTSKDSFAYLMNQYSITNNATSTTAITRSPLYFVPYGYIHSGSLWDAGHNGDYWSSTADSSASHAYYLFFNSGNINTSGGILASNLRYNGFSVRCLAD